MEILVTKRLTLRPPLEVDVEGIAKELANPNVSKMLSSVPLPYTEADAQKFIARTRNAPKSLYFTIHRNALVGVISVQEGKGVLNLGYWLGEEHWGQGYIGEAAQAVVAHTFRKFGDVTIQSGAYEDNPASLRILEKLGFEPTRVIEDFNATRGCTVTCKKVELKREKFVRLFGPLETNQAA